MSKKTTNSRAKEEELRQSRKEVLLARKQAQQTRQLRIALGLVGVLIVAVLAVAVINELFVAPNRSVATVNDDQISLKAFQEQVSFERARRVVLLEDQLTAFGGDVGIIQQFANQLLVDMYPTNAETFGETVLNQMVDDVLIRQAAQERGITVTDAEVDAEIGRSFNFFDGGLPTPLPTATQTAVPTPSVTPIPTAVITDVLPTATSFPTPTAGPTNTPQPTATPVTADAFQQQLSDLLQQYTDLGVNQNAYRESVRMQLYRQKLADVLAVEEELPRDAEHANFYVLVFDNRAEADDVASTLTADNFLEVWNTIRSQQSNPDATSTAFATELFNRTQDDLATTFNQELATAVFEQALNAPTPVITITGQDGTTNFVIAVPSGRELAPLSDSAYQTKKDELVASLLTTLRGGNVVLGDFWRGRVPMEPALDNKFYATPTPAPDLTLPTVAPEAATPAP
ncbi:MAG: SurA N-terminal domain-containing protein [Chloroflexi bacterium]|nr:SurA N-terminal domain-containing protein [Chloroflexota bacterium]MBP7043929.1 SurA N-terminal domain-containing protein [Chloroflexota bacterium]